MLEFGGEYTGDIHLTFAYDPALLPVGFDETSLAIYHFNGTSWDMLTGVVNELNNTITVTTPGLSPFMLGISPVPEPSAVILMVAGAGALFLYRRRRALSKS